MLFHAVLRMFQSTLPTRGSDANGAYDAIARDRFQSTLPTRGSDNQSRWFGERFERFNPRSPRGGATRQAARSTRVHERFNPRSPRGGATGRDIVAVRPCAVSIHAPHEGERLADGADNVADLAQFQSTLPTRGSDGLLARRVDMGRRFNPRSPRGGATPTCFISPPLSLFQSTLPTRGSDGGKVHLYAAFPRIY